MQIPDILDDKLIQEVSDGNYEGEFKKLYRFAQTDFLEIIAKSRNVNRNDLSSLISDAFVVLIRKIEAGQITASKHACLKYFRGILNNLLKKYFTENKLYQWSSDETAVFERGEEMDVELDTKQLTTWTYYEKCIASPKMKRCRKALEGKYLEGKSEEELAEDLGISLKAVKVFRSRCREKIEQMVKEMIQNS